LLAWVVGITRARARVSARLYTVTWCPSRGALPRVGFELRERVHERGSVVSQVCGFGFAVERLKAWVVYQVAAIR